MREIKFRAWDKRSGKMYYPDTSIEFEKYISFGGKITYFEDDDGGKNGLHEHNSIYREEEKQSVLMQFTGLVDRNGKDIYEGDIVWVVNGSEGKQIAEVIWNKDGFCWHLKRGTIANGWGLYQWRGEADDIQVIGNIYENPWLIAKTEVA